MQSEIWCSRPESNRYDLAIDGFSYLPQLSLPLRVQRLGSGLSLHHSLLAIGAARLVSTPSEFLRLGSGLASAQYRSLAGSVPRIWAVLLSTFPLRHSNRISPLRLPIPPRELSDPTYRGDCEDSQAKIMSVRVELLFQITLVTLARRSRSADVDRRSVKPVLDVRGVMLLDHLHAGTAVLGDLVDVCALHQPKADVSVAKAVGRAAVAFSVEFQPFLVEDTVE